MATAVALILVGLGTNLFFYTAHEGPMSHSYNFALITIFLYLVIRWYENPVKRILCVDWIDLWIDRSDPSFQYHCRHLVPFLGGYRDGNHFRKGPVPVKEIPSVALDGMLFS